MTSMKKGQALPITWSFCHTFRWTRTATTTDYDSILHMRQP